MRIIDPQSGQPYFKKLRKRFNERDSPRELTFSCYHCYGFLSRERTREWFREALEAARSEFGIQLWAYVLMPEHVHLLVYPGSTGCSPRPSKTQGVPPNSTNVPPNNPVEDRIPGFLQALKEPVARKAIAYLRTNAPTWLARITVQEGQRVRHRFWQPGGGYDRNVTDPATLRFMIDYIHNNPVRRGLVSRPEEWEWSSARWYARIRPVKIEMDDSVLEWLGTD
jgi:putative transposase